MTFPSVVYRWYFPVQCIDDMIDDQSGLSWNVYGTSVLCYFMKGFPHTSILQTLTICNFRSVKAIDFKCGQQEAQHNLMVG